MKLTPREKQKEVLADLYCKRDWIEEDIFDVSDDPELYELLMEDLADIDALISIEKEKLRSLKG
jgi:hypothetical protein